MVASPVLDIKMITEVQKCSAIKKKKQPTVKKETPNPQHLLPTRLKISAETKLVVNFTCGPRLLQVAIRILMSYCDFKSS